MTIVALGVSAAIFVVYLLNVIIGSFGGDVFLSDVAEMVTLFIACLFFVVAILFEERRTKKDIID